MESIHVKEEKTLNKKKIISYWMGSVSAPKDPYQSGTMLNMKTMLASIQDIRFPKQHQAWFDLTVSLLLQEFTHLRDLDQFNLL